MLKPGTALLAGAFWGMGVCACAAMIGELPAGVPGALVAIGLAVLIPMLYFGLGAWFREQIGFQPLLLGLGWVGVELALVHAGLGHRVLVAERCDDPVVGIVGQVLGYGLAAFVVAYVSALLIGLAAEWCPVPWRPRRVVLSGGRNIKPDGERRFAWFQLCDLSPAQPRAPPLK